MRGIWGNIIYYQSQSIQSSRLSSDQSKGASCLIKTKRFGRNVTSCNLIVSSRLRFIHFWYIQYYINTYCPLVHIIEPLYQVSDRTLSTSTTPNQGYWLANIHIKIQPFQDLIYEGKAKKIIKKNSLFHPMQFSNHTSRWSVWQSKGIIIHNYINYIVGLTYKWMCVNHKKLGELLVYGHDSWRRGLKPTLQNSEMYTDSLYHSSNII